MDKDTISQTTTTTTKTTVPVKEKTPVDSLLRSGSGNDSDSDNDGNNNTNLIWNIWKQIKKDFIMDAQFHRWILVWSGLSFASHQIFHRYYFPYLHRYIFHKVQTIASLSSSSSVSNVWPERITSVAAQMLLPYSSINYHSENIPYEQSAIVANRMFNLTHNIMACAVTMYFLRKHPANFQQTIQSVSVDCPSEYRNWYYMSLAYFVVDLIYLLRYEKHSSDFIFHHLIGIITCSGLIPFKGGGHAWKYMLLSAELPSIVLNAAHMLHHAIKLLEEEYLPRANLNLQFLIGNGNSGGVGGQIIQKILNGSSILVPWKKILTMGQLLFAIGYFVVRFYFIPKLTVGVLGHLNTQKYKETNHHFLWTYYWWTLMTFVNGVGLFWGFKLAWHLIKLKKPKAI